MRAYGKEWNYNVYSCEYCLFWKGRKVGCMYSDGCCCPVAQKPPVRFGVQIQYPEIEHTIASQPKCDGCPYGRDTPCIGWCTKELLRSVRGCAK